MGTTLRLIAAAAALALAAGCTEEKTVRVPRQQPGTSSGAVGTSTAGGTTGGGTTTGGTTTGGGATTSGTTTSGTTTGGTTGGGTTSGGTTSGGTTTAGGTAGGGTTTSGGSTSSGGTSGGTTGTPAGVVAIEVNTATLNVRAGPGTGFDIIGESHQGEVYVQFETSGTWRRIWFDDGPGWVSGSYVVPSSASVKAVTADILNVRTGPGTQYQIIGRLYGGMLRAVLASSGDWRKISFDGREAWVHGSYLGDPAAATPSAQLAPPLPRSSRGFLQLPASGPGYYCYSPTDRRWGVARFIYGFLRLAREHDALHPAWARIGVGDISLENGGPISGHASHQKGVDGDFRLQTTDGSEQPLTIFDPLYSRPRQQDVVDRFYDHMDVTHIFFNDTQVSGVQSWPNHDNHIHVRIAE